MSMGTLSITLFHPLAMRGWSRAVMTPSARFSPVVEVRTHTWSVSMLMREQSPTLTPTILLPAKGLRVTAVRRMAPEIHFLPWAVVRPLAAICPLQKPNVRVSVWARDGSAASNTVRISNNFLITESFENGKLCEFTRIVIL